mgnify:CR=1 FL=1
MSEKFKVVSYRKNSSYSEQEEAEMANLLKVIEKFTAKICRTFSDKMVEATRNNNKYVILFKYNDDPDKGEFFNDKIDNISTKYILSGVWIRNAQKFFLPQKCKSVSSRILEYISDKKFNNGIDIVSKQKYNVSIFHYKNKNSIFSNGIIVSRDGIIYK